MKPLAVLLLLLTGCASVGEPVFQTVHLVDTIQTFHGAASDKCYGEADPVTRRLIGSEPSHAGVIAWGVGYAALHYGITRWLTETGHDRIATVWEVLTIADTARDVGRNIEIGIRIGRPNTDHYHGVDCQYPGGNER